jgi:hypothetical protein
MDACRGFPLKGACMSKRKNLIIAFVVITAAALPLSAQTDRSSLEGTITDPSGATISGARVRISAAETGITEERTTNSNGQYRFPGIAIGEYKVSVSNSGFKTEVIGDVVLQVGQTRTLDVSLQIGEETKLTERFGLQFGVQAFNVFNHAQLGDPGSLTLNYLPGGDAPPTAGANLSAPVILVS